MGDEAAVEARRPRRGSRRFLDFTGDGYRLSAAERRLLACCRVGEPCVVGDRAASGWPDEADDGNRVSAELLRFLALGGDADAPVHERGIDLAGAWIDGRLDLYGTRVVRAIELKRCRIEAVDVQWATLPSMDLVGCVVLAGFDGDGVRVDGGLFVRHGTHVRCEVRLPAASIGGGLYCEGALLDNPGGTALNCEEAKIALRLGLNAWVREERGGDARTPFAANGTVSLNGATIGILECHQARITTAPERIALNAPGVKVSGQASLYGGAFTGQVVLVNAAIGGDLICRDARFTSPWPADADGKEARFALTCAGGHVGGDLWLDEGMTADGQVSLTGATIGGSLWCDGASFTSGAGYCLDCEGAKVGRTFALRQVRAFGGAVTLYNMSVDTLADDAGSWRKADGRLSLDGFTYQRLVSDDLPQLVAPDARRGRWRSPPESRVAWLKLQRRDYWETGFRPQPWEQLAKVLRAMGHPNRAREVGFQKEKALQATGVTRNWRLRPLRSLFHTVYGLFTGFGYKTNRIVWILSGTWGLFALAYLWAMTPCAVRPCVPAQLFVASKPVPAPAPRPVFDAALYSLDALLPIDLGYLAKWEATERPSGRAMRWIVVVETILGWIFAGVVGSSALGMLIKRD